MSEYILYMNLINFAEKIDKEIGTLCSPLGDRRKKAIVEMIVSIKDISVKHELDTHSIVNILPKLTDVFLHGSKIDQDVEWNI